MIVVKELRDNVRMDQKKGQELRRWSVMVSDVVFTISYIEDPCIRSRVIEKPIPDNTSNLDKFAEILLTAFSLS